MDSPYRSAPHSDRAEAPRDRGIVGDVVAQFADPLAFLRELVQNAIDAGTPSVEVELRHDAGAGAVRAIVRDRGEGMDRDVLENHLLVLFRSTKDRDPTKIGKFGIGFSSVLAPGPRVVVVDTVRGGHRLVLHLHPDLTYQLFEGGPASRSGTSVELELPVEPAGVDDLIERSRAALVRWCRHAAVPIHLIARGAGGEVVREVRIDTPLALEDALVEVRGVSSDGATTAVVGLRAGGAPYGGFFNRGLMLHETREPLAGALAFKVLDARLGHTLSRDDVRRDRAFDGALALVRKLGGGALRRAAVAALASAAMSDVARWRTLFEAIDQADLAFDDEEWVAPLLAPIGEATAIAPATLPARRAWAARARTPVIDALAAARVPVVALAAPGLAARVERSCGRALVDVGATLTLIAPVAPSPSDLALLDELTGLLSDAGRSVKAIVLADVAGALGHLAYLCGGRDDALIDIDDARWVIDRETGGADPFRRMWRRTLILNAGAGMIAAARRRAEHAPVEAAAVVARAVLLHRGALDVATSTAILESTATRLGLRGADR